MKSLPDRERRLVEAAREYRRAVAEYKSDLHSHARINAERLAYERLAEALSHPAYAEATKSGPGSAATCVQPPTPEQREGQDRAGTFDCRLSDGCCHKTRVVGHPCPVGYACPFDRPTPQQEG